MTPGQIKAFLQDLAAISEKHGIVIAGCGCCGSPFLESVGQWQAVYACTEGGDGVRPRPHNMGSVSFWEALPIKSCS